jgi:ParB family transcriptional regulator, chromosome partitioning protein
MIKKIRIADIKGASYNPRYLSPEAKQNLIISLTDFGQIKPIIVREENNTIVAGHQRTKVIAELGFEYVDAILLKNVTQQDEVRFNQLHNLCEVEINELQPYLKIPSNLHTGYNVVKSAEITIIKKNQLGTILSELNSLILRYGNFGSCIANQKGEIIVSSLYANAIKLLGMDLMVYVIDDCKTEFCINTFKKDYGVYNYEHLEKTTYVQTWAQMKRLKGTKQLQSTLYQTQVIPFLKTNKQLRCLDFGSGTGAYATMLRAKGYNIKDIEFYRKLDGKNIIDTNKVINDFKIIAEDVEKNGLFDVVICDSVLNSVDSLQAEQAVLVTLNAFCKEGGTIFWSGRPPDSRGDMKKTKGGTYTLYFTDKNLFTANYRNGYWFYQKFHTDEMIAELTKKYIGSKYKTYKNSTSFQVVAVKKSINSIDLIEKALSFEFTLPLPNGSYKIYTDNQLLFNKIKQWNTQQ